MLASSIIPTDEALEQRWTPMTAAPPPDQTGIVVKTKVFFLAFLL
jgi:hypothetical protein